MARTGTLDPDEWALWHTWMQAHRLLARELDRCLQRDYGISKTEFSVLVTLRQAPGAQVRVAELVESLGWEKSRVSHQLTRMEARGLVERIDSETSGRRAGIALTEQGRRAVQQAVTGHGGNIRRLFFDETTPEQVEAIRVWSEQTVERLA